MAGLPTDYTSVLATDVIFVQECTCLARLYSKYKCVPQVQMFPMCRSLYSRYKCVLCIPKWIGSPSIAQVQMFPVCISVHLQIIPLYCILTLNYSWQPNCHSNV